MSALVLLQCPLGNSTINTWFLKCSSQFQSIAHTDTDGNVFLCLCQGYTTETRLKLLIKGVSITTGLYVYELKACSSCESIECRPGSVDAYWSYNSNSSIQSVREWPKILSHLCDRIHEVASKAKEKTRDRASFQFLSL